LRGFRQPAVFVLLAVFGLLPVSGLLAGCLPFSSGQRLPTVGVTPLPAETLEPAGLPAAYPDTPEGVVEAFLQLTQEDPRLMIAYLSRRAQDDLPPGGALDLLGLDGPVEGYLVESAAASPDPPAAVVQIAALSGGREYRLSFELVQEGSVWVIDRVLME